MNGKFEIGALMVAFITSFGNIIIEMIKSGKASTTSYIIVVGCGFLIFQSLIKKSKKKKFNALEHQFFSEMNRNINICIPKITMTNKLKEDCAKKFLTIKYNVFLNYFKERYSKELFNSNEYKDIVFKMIQEYELIANNEGIPKEFIDRFHAEHNDTVDMVITGINNICSVDRDEEVKHDMILILLTSAFAHTIGHTVKIFERMNGKLQKILCKHCDENNEERICSDCIKTLKVEPLSNDISKHDNIPFENQMNAMKILFLERKDLFDNDRTTDYFFFVLEKISESMSFVNKMHCESPSQNLILIRSIFNTTSRKIRQAGKDMLGQKFITEYIMLRASKNDMFMKNLEYRLEDRCFTFDLIQEDMNEFLSELINDIYKSCVKSNLT